MKIKTSNEQKLYIQPQIKVIELEACELLADSNDPQNEDPDVIYPNLRD